MIVRYEITYKQTDHERYDTDVNSRVEQAIDAAGLEILGSWGGSGYSPDPDALIADNGYEVEATMLQIEDVVDDIRDIIGAPQTLRFAVPAKEEEN